MDHKSFYDKGSLDFLWDPNEWWYHNRKWKWTLSDKYFTESNGCNVINIKIEADK